MSAPPRDSWPVLPKISRPEQTTSEHLRRRAEMQRAILAARTNRKAPKEPKA
jgi:hypothetical protein